MRGVIGIENYGLRYQPFETGGRKMWDVPPAEPKPGDPGYKKPPTQEDIDKWYAIAKGNEEKLKIVTEKLNKAEEDKVAILASRAQPKVFKKPLSEMTLAEQFNEDNPPQTEEDWNALHDENPSFATELQFKIREKRESFSTTVKNTVESIVTAHPDMY